MAPGTSQQQAEVLHRLHGVLFLLLGVVSLADGWRIARQARVNQREQDRLREDEPV